MGWRGRVLSLGRLYVDQVGSCCAQGKTKVHCYASEDLGLLAPIEKTHGGQGSVS